MVLPAHAPTGSSGGRAGWVTRDAIGYHGGLERGDITTTVRKRLNGMSLYIDSSSHLHHDQDQNLVVTCAHCQTVAHITPSAVPRFEDLQLYRPKQVGIVYLCDACHAPVFLRFTVRVYGTARIELSPQFTEVERAREKFSFTYIPEEVELLFKEALTCFTQDAFNAFGSMCRRTLQAMFTDLGESGKLRSFDELNGLRELTDISPELFTRIKNVLFGAELDARAGVPLLDGYQAGVLLEVVKDLLYEAYVRKGRLQQAIMVRRFFLDETGTNIRPLIAS
jgi:hypothetical protein